MASAQSTKQLRQPREARRGTKAGVSKTDPVTYSLGEAFYKTVLESLEDYAVFTTDLQGRITTWNKGAERLFSYLEKEIVGRPADLLYMPEDRTAQVPKQELELAAVARRAPNERYHVRKDGSRFWGSGLVFPLNDETGKLRGFTKILRDLSNRQEWAEQLKQSKERYQALIENNADIIALSDENGNYSYVSPSIKKILGYAPDEFLKLNGFKLMHPDELAYIGEEFQQLLAHPGASRTIELRVRHKDGSWRWLEATATNLLSDPRICAVVSNLRDINDRKAAEDKLRDSEELFRLIVQEVQDYAIFHLDPKGFISSWNTGTEHIKGYSAEEVIGKHVSIFYTPEDRREKHAEKLLREAKLKGQAEDEGWRVRKDGTRFWAHATITALKDDAGKLTGFSKITRDITNHKMHQENLRQNEERFALAQQAANIGTFEWNIKTGEFLCTEQLEALYGMKRREMSGKLENWTARLHPTERERVQAELDAAINGKRLDTEFRIVRPNGDERWIAMRAKVFMDKDGKPERVLGINRNVTKRHHAEEHLRESEERFRQLADAMPQIVWTTGPDGKPDYYNRQWYEYTGCRQGTEPPWETLLHPDDKEFIMEAWQHCVDTGDPYQVEFRFIDPHRTGKYRWFLGKARPWKDHDGTITKWFGTCTDIDAIKRTTKDRDRLEKITATLIEQRKQLVQLNNAKDEFISLASHQLRTPATGVKQYVGMVLEGYMGRLTKEQKSMLNLAFESNERQLKIIDDLLKIAHIDAGKVEVKLTECPLVPLLHDILQEQLSTVTARKQKLVFDRPDADVIVKADPALIRMVLENIADNASKYTPEGKRIRVGIRVNPKTSTAMIDVTDQGVGIAKEDFPKLFQKFTRLQNPLSRAVGGTGLGLYWVKRVIDLHHGTITVKSELNKGTTFTIELQLTKT